jgi:hypothetical protein
MSAENRKYILVSGASWLDLAGNVYIVPGFHEEWIQANSSLVGGLRTVPEVVAGLHWVSVVSYKEGYVEFTVDSRKDLEALSALWRFLSVNKGSWKTAFIMFLDEDGYIELSYTDAFSEETFCEIVAGRAFCIEPVPEYGEQ